MFLGLLSAMTQISSNVTFFIDSFELNFFSKSDRVLISDLSIYNMYLAKSASFFTYFQKTAL